MQNDKVVVEESQAAPPITPEGLAMLKKEDMRQAVVERFRRTSEAPAPRKTARSRTRSPYWRPADDEC